MSNWCEFYIEDMNNNSKVSLQKLLETVLNGKDYTTNKNSSSKVLFVTLRGDNGETVKLLEELISFSKLLDKSSKVVIGVK